MKSIHFWKTQIKELSITQRIFFRDAILTLLSWEALKGEYLELDLMRRMLESDISITEEHPSDNKSAATSRILASTAGFDCVHKQKKENTVIETPVI